MKQHITTLFTGGVLALALIRAAMAGPLEDGEAAFQRGDDATALQIFRPTAEQGFKVTLKFFPKCRSANFLGLSSYGRMARWPTSRSRRGDRDARSVHLLFP
jgi:hypothetical protein